MKKNEKVQTYDIRKITATELADKNIQLEDKLFSNFIKSDYESIKNELPGKNRKQRQIYNYIEDIQEELYSISHGIREILDDNLWKIYETGYEMALYSIMSRIADYKNDLLKIKNINSRYSDEIIKLLFEKDVMNHNELAQELNVTPNNLSNIMRRIRDSKADVIRSEKSGKYKIYYLTDNGIRYAKKLEVYNNKKEDKYFKEVWKRSVLKQSKSYEDKFNINMLPVIERKYIHNQRHLLSDIQAVTTYKEKQLPAPMVNKNICVIQKSANINSEELIKNEKQSGEISRRIKRNMERRTNKKVLC